MKIFQSLLEKPYFKKALLVGFLLSVFNNIGCQTLPQKKKPKFTQKVDIGPFLFKALVERKNSLNDFKSFARTIVNKNDRKQSIKQAIVIRGDNSIRIDVLSLFNQPLGVFIQKDDQTFLFDPSKNRYYRDEDALIFIERLLGMKLNFEEFIPLASANIPFLNRLTATDSWISEDSSTYKLFLQLEGMDLDFVLEIDAENRIPRKVTKLLKGKEVYSVTWENFKTVDGYDMPHILEWSNSNSNESLVVKLNKPVPNTGVKDSAFNLNIPVN